MYTYIHREEFSGSYPTQVIIFFPKDIDSQIKSPVRGRVIFLTWLVEGVMEALKPYKLLSLFLVVHWSN